MWKCTGSSSSAHTSHSGSHARSARSGAPWSCGSDGDVHAAQAEARARAATSRTQASTSHAGITAIGSSRLPDSPASRRWRRCRSRGRALRSADVGRRRSPRLCPPRPTMLGNTTCAQMPVSSMSSRRARRDRTSPRGACSISHSYSPSNDRPLLPCVSTTPPAPAPPEHRALDDPASRAPSTRSTCGHAVLQRRRRPAGPEVVLPR